MFSGTIFQNVVDGLAGTNMTELLDEEKRKLVIESCKAAYAHDFIESLPKVSISPPSLCHFKGSTE